MPARAPPPPKSTIENAAAKIGERICSFRDTPIFGQKSPLPLTVISVLASRRDYGKMGPNLRLAPPEALRLAYQLSHEKNQNRYCRRRQLRQFARSGDKFLPRLIGERGRSRVNASPDRPISTF